MSNANNDLPTETRVDSVQHEIDNSRREVNEVLQTEHVEVTDETEEEWQEISPRGTNPPREVLEGFLRRTWQAYEVSKISFLPNGLFVVRFGKAEHLQLVLNNGMFLFDGKPPILRAWDPNDRISKVKVKSVPIWVKLVGLDLKFWGAKCLEKLASLIGKFVRIDDLTVERTLLGFARVLVEVEIDQKFPTRIEFEDELGKDIHVAVEYDWLPITCDKCKGIGHAATMCRRKEFYIQKPKQVQGSTNATPAATSVLASVTPLITPMASVQGSVFTLARVVTCITRHESRLHGAKEGNFMKDFSNEMGLNSTNKQKDVKWFLHQHDLCLFGLLETRVKAQSQNKVAENVCYGWDYTTNISCHQGGQIWLLWKSAMVSVDVIEMDAQYIHTRVLNKLNNDRFYATFVYGFNKIEDKAPLWQNLIRLNVQDPWIVMGDFNAVMYANERLGGLVKDEEVVPFQDTAAECDLQDLKSYGAFLRGTINNLVTLGCLAELIELWAPEYHQVVQHNWNSNVYGTAMFRVVKRLKLMKSALKKLNGSLFSDIERNTDVAFKVMIHTQEELQKDPYNKQLMDIERQTRESYHLLATAKEEFLRQKAKCAWAKDGDVNSAMFHRLIKKRQLHNKVLQIQDAAGVVCKEPEDILNAFLSYYKQLLGSSAGSANVIQHTNGPTVDCQLWEKMCKIPTEEEVKNVILSIPDEKSPGPDSFTSKFFKTSWSTIKDDLCEAVTDFFNSGQLLKQLLCERIAEVLPSIFNPAQSAFIKGRSILGNILITQDLVRLYSRKSAFPRCLMKIDLRKAYDSIEWNCVKQILVGLNFPPKLIELIMQCISTTSYSICLNGHTHGYFKGERGLRQGDPISPLIFTLCMEYLSRLIEKSVSLPRFKFHPLCKSLKLTHLMFADDLLIFCKGDLKSITILMETFNVFSAATGLNISNEKSDIYLNGVDQEVENNILRTTGFRKGSLPFKYLGVCISHKRISRIDCNILVDKMITRIRGWNKRKISYSGRIQALCRNFLWEGEDTYSKALLVAWSILCKDKKVGGLSVTDSRIWNIAAIGKLAWWILIKKDHLWIRWADNIYLKGRDWLTYTPTVNSSWAWRKICEVRTKFLGAYTTSLWQDNSNPYTIAKGYRWLTQTDDVKYWIGVKVSGLQTGVLIMKERSQSMLIRLLKSAAIVGMFYHIWLIRNSCRIQHYVRRPALVIQEVQIEVKLRFQAVFDGQLKTYDLEWCRNHNLI
ncbi:uncharacterized protein LOC141643690 [Silene latifolia]|uniref:uncharacterized protein LOC141643690 n=1 Tax=Silene latifolia TaxID=37657 RepID=UPI003D76FBB9